jgi:hypothetical protein
MVYRYNCVLYLSISQFRLISFSKMNENDWGMYRFRFASSVSVPQNTIKTNARLQRRTKQCLSLSIG